MVWLTVKPSLRAASCCSVEVVNGYAGERLRGFCCMLPMVNVASLHASRKAMASSCVAKRLSSSALISLPFTVNTAVTLK